MSGAQNEPETVKVIEFRLFGNHSEDTVTETLEAVGYNTTVFEPLENGTIIVVTAAVSTLDDN
jgi:hypothetical protein